VARPLLPVFERFFDDAGLFPPASRPMAEALAAHARARNGPHARLVGPFRCPLTRLEELDACVDAGLPRPPELCVVVTRGEIRWRRATARADVSQIEAPPDEQPPTDVLRVQRYLELPLRGDLEMMADRLGRAGARAKVRCGGPAADLVPSSEVLARAVAACAARRLPLKATGGVHRPFRLKDASPGGPQHGFVNLLAAASAALAGADTEHLVEILDTEEDEGSELLGRIDRHARLVVSVECTSLDDAVGHLQSLGVL
jgi:hypothetical protein